MLMDKNKYEKGKFGLGCKSGTSILTMTKQLSNQT